MRLIAFVVVAVIALRVWCWHEFDRDRASK